MTDADYTHLLLIVDRSGSMSNIADDMNGGIGALLDEQAKLPGILRVDAWTFDTKVERVASGVAADHEVLENLVVPRGSTALYDAIGLAVNDLGQHLAALAEDRRPGKVVVVIVTDGHENSSREYSAGTVKALVTEQQDTYDWQFVFLGANIDSFSVGGAIGLSKGSTMDFLPSEQGVESVWASTSSSLAAYRSGVTASVAYTEEDRKAAAPETPKTTGRTRSKDSK